MANDVKAANVDNTYRSDHQKASDRTGTTDCSAMGPNATREHRDRASDKANDAANKAKEAGDALMDKASDVGQSMQETGQSIAQKSKHAHKVVCEFTKDNPTAAVLLAFSLGTILVRILPGR